VQVLEERIVVNEEHFLHPQVAGMGLTPASAYNPESAWQKKGERRYGRQVTMADDFLVYRAAAHESLRHSAIMSRCAGATDSRGGSRS